MLLKELLSGLDYRLIGVDACDYITRPYCDSRRVEPGGVFVCLSGRGADGESYVGEAVASGAVCIVAERVIEGVPCACVPDTRYALAVMWNNYFGRPGEGMRLYGITGTNGKTSTAAFLASCLSAGGRSVGSVGTLGIFCNGERIGSSDGETLGAAAAMTTPDPEYLYGALRALRDSGVTDCVMEVSSHAVSYRKTDPLKFDIGIFTNLSPEHLDHHKTMEEYYRAKASFVARCERRIVNGDDSDCRRFAQSIPCTSLGMDSVRELRADTGGVSYKMCFNGSELFMESCIGGEFTVYNSMLSAGAALLAGVHPTAVERGTRALAAVKGRLERVVRMEEHGFDLIIDYAHTPAALESVLTHLRKTLKGRLICVFGCGGERDRQKRPLMGRVAERLSDAVIVTGDNPRCEEPLGIIRDIIGGMVLDNSVVIPDRREAIFCAVSVAGRGDTVLLAGKGHETYEIRGEKKLEFDEREVVREALRIKLGT